MERAGVPTVAIVSTGFVGDAKATARALGVPGLRLAVTDDCLTNMSPDEIVRQVDKIMEVIADALTRPADVEGRVCDPSARPRPAGTETFEGTDAFDAFERMNAEFLDRGWGDGFPLIPPTPDRVAQMLKGTRRDPQDVVTVLEPGLGFATIEKIAINAVMAGCQPEHLPILMAATDAINDRTTNIRTIAMSTGPHAPLLVVNGPIARRIGLNAGQCALGPGKQSRVNTVIGRAFRLIMMNVGQVYPGSMDLDTIGSPAKYSMCIAENEDKSPWEPLHQERGYRRDQSTVTVFGIRHLIGINDLQNHSPEGILTTVATSAAMPGGDYMETRLHHHHVLLLAPDHARCIGDAGWTKQSIRLFLYHNTRSPLRLQRNNHPVERIFPEWRWVLSIPPDTPLPVVGAPDWYQIVVVGGPAGKSIYLHSEGGSATRLIEEPEEGEPT